MRPQTLNPYLDLRALAALEHMRFTARQRVEGNYSGRHRSRQPGGAGEFVDYRSYVDGEDLRRLDWKVFSRTGRAYVRLYQDETNLLSTIVLDASASMTFAGERTRGAAAIRPAPDSKMEYARYLATALSHIIIRQQDQVGLAVIGDGLRSFLAPAGSPQHALSVQEAIARSDAAPATQLAEGLRQLQQRLRRRGVLLILSDFLVDDLDDLFAAIRLFRHRRFEVIALHLVHPAEEHLPGALAYRFEGLEGEGRLDCSPADIRRLYEERFAAHLAAVRRLALAVGCDYRRVSTTTPYMQTLGTFLVERAG